VSVAGRAPGRAEREREYDKKREAAVHSAAAYGLGRQAQTAGAVGATGNARPAACWMQ
jgi:hypothetical protein